jgi:hypothetical protein
MHQQVFGSEGRDDLGLSSGTELGHLAVSMQ